MIFDNEDIPVRFSKEENAYDQQKQTMAQKTANLEEVQERKKQFDQLESDIKDLNSMFKDIAVIVHEQGQDIGKNE